MSQNWLKWITEHPTGSRNPQEISGMIKFVVFWITIHIIGGCWSKWLCSLRCRSTAARLLWSLVWFHLEAWMFGCCVCCVLSGRGLCDELITRPEESYQLERCCEQGGHGPRWAAEPEKKKKIGGRWGSVFTAILMMANLIVNTVISVPHRHVDFKFCVRRTKMCVTLKQLKINFLTNINVCYA
jgi:hypothetical protein